MSSFNFLLYYSKLISVLRSSNKRPYLVSGGFDCLIHPVAAQLGIPNEDVFSNKLKFHFDGTYAGFDETEPTSKSGGKSKVVELIKNRRGHSIIITIGDGATDLETCPPADAFIGKHSAKS